MPPQSRPNPEAARQERMNSLLQQIQQIQQRVDQKPALWKQIAAAALAGTRHGRGFAPMLTGDAERERALMQLSPIQAQIRAELAQADDERLSRKAEIDSQLTEEQIKSQQSIQNERNARADRARRVEPPTPRTRNPQDEVYTVGEDGQYKTLSPGTPKPATPPRETPEQARERRRQEWVAEGQDPNSREGRSYILTGHIPNPQAPREASAAEMNRADGRKAANYAGALLKKHGLDKLEAAMAEAATSPEIPDDMRVTVANELKRLVRQQQQGGSPFLGGQAINFGNKPPAPATTPATPEKVPPQPAKQQYAPGDKVGPLKDGTYGKFVGYTKEGKLILDDWDE